MIASMPIKLRREYALPPSSASRRSILQKGSSMAMKDLSLSKVYQLLEPGPVVLLTTARKGRANIMTMSWHMMVEFEPRWSPVW